MIQMGGAWVTFEAFLDSVLSGGAGNSASSCDGGAGSGAGSGGVGSCGLAAARDDPDSPCCDPTWVPQSKRHRRDDRCHDLATPLDGVSCLQLGPEARDWTPAAACSPAASASAQARERERGPASVRPSPNPSRSPAWGMRRAATMPTCLSSGKGRVRVCVGMSHRVAFGCAPCGWLGQTLPRDHCLTRP